LGAQAAPEIEKEFEGKLTNPAIQSYVNSVGQRVALVSHRRDIQYHYAVVNSNTPNALALPGGYIYITRGLLVNLENEAQLAAVLGHETGHVTALHGVRQLQRNLGISLVLDAIGSATESTRVQSMAKVVANLANLRYSREDETQADELGAEYAYKAGYKPVGNAGFTERS